MAQHIVRHGTAQHLRKAYHSMAQHGGTAWHGMVAQHGTARWSLTVEGCREVYDIASASYGHHDSTLQTGEGGLDMV